VAIFSTEMMPPLKSISIIFYRVLIRFVGN
jgi:hypothetical protein